MISEGLTFWRGLPYSWSGLRGPQDDKWRPAPIFFSVACIGGMAQVANLYLHAPSHSHTARKNGNTKQLLTKRVAMRTQRPWYVTTCNRGYGFNNPKQYALCRLKSAGLALLLTQMSKKPKNPV